MPLVPSKHFKYVEKNIAGEVVSGIMILQPEKWKGFVYTYTGGQIGTTRDENGRAEVKYEFNILDNKPNISDPEMIGEEFTNLLGNIFVDIVEVAYSK